MKLTLIERPAWASEPCLEVEGVSEDEYANLRLGRVEMLAVVHREVDSYVHDLELCSDSPGMFPERSRLAGTYYLGDELYVAHRDPDWFQIGVRCRLLELPKPGMARPDDYLGLQVWLRCLPGRWKAYEVFRNTDSSVI